MMKKNQKYLVLLLMVTVLQSFRKIETVADEYFGLTALPVAAPAPKDNPITDEKISLGKVLFFDPILSGNNKISCVTCHSPNKGFTDGLDRSAGFLNGTHTNRNSPTVLNAAFNGLDEDGNINPTKSPQFYDNRAMSLEEQCLGPLLSPIEMKGPSLSSEEYIAELEQEVSNISVYRELFYEAFGDSAISIENITKAIATYERTLTTPNSPFDRYMRGDKTAMSPIQIRGMKAFVSTGCASCHSGPMFSDYKLHVLGVETHPGLSAIDKGDGNYAFRTTTLRNLEYTAPYMHNGMHQTLEEVMKFYERKQSRHPQVSQRALAPEFKALKLNPFTQSKVDDIIAFLKALNDPSFDKTTPNSVPSGLPL